MKKIAAINEIKLEIIPSFRDLIHPLRPRVTRKKKKLTMKIMERIRGRFIKVCYPVSGGLTDEMFGR